MAIIGPEHLNAKDFMRATFAFVLVALGGVIIGIIAALVSGLTTKFANTLNVVQPLICLIFPYLAYLLAEMAHYSGILAIMVCGLLMKPYVSYNMSDESRITVKYFLKTIASHSEAMIFIFLGLSTFSKNHSWDFVFTVITVIACIVSRLIGIYLLSYICNMYRTEKIGLVDQFVMAYGGLRGAICYGLVMTLDKDSVPAKDMFVSTTVVVICVTVFIQGTTIKPLTKFLHVKTNENRRKTVTDIFISHAQDDIMAGIEAIVGVHGKYFWERRVREFNRNYVKPFLTTQTTSRGDEIVRQYTQLEDDDERAKKRSVSALVTTRNTDDTSNISTSLLLLTEKKWSTASQTNDNRLNENGGSLATSAGNQLYKRSFIELDDQDTEMGSISADF